MNEAHMNLNLMWKLFIEKIIIIDDSCSLFTFRVTFCKDITNTNSQYCTVSTAQLLLQSQSHPQKYVIFSLLRRKHA